MRSTARAKPRSISILVANSSQLESQLLVRALRRRAEFKVTSCGLDAEAVIDSISGKPVDVVVLSIDHSEEAWPEMSLVRRIHLAYPELPKILLLNRYDRELVLSAFRSGVKGLFCFSQYPFRLLCKCIQSVFRGQVWVNSEQLRYLVEAMAHVPSLRVVNAGGSKLLTPREEQVVALVADGRSNRAIGEELQLSEHTIKKYLFHIFEKLGISTRVELVLYAVNNGDNRHSEWMAGATR